MRVLSLIATTLLVSCASMPDGETTTIEAIVSDPQAWDGKWVSVSGVVSKTGGRLYIPQDVVDYPQDETSYPILDDRELYLDPADADPDDERTFGRDPPGEAARVSGRVRIDCWEFWEPHFRVTREMAERGRIWMVHPRAPENIAYCNFVSGPHLERVRIQPTADETASMSVADLVARAPEHAGQWVQIDGKLSYLPDEDGPDLLGPDGTSIPIASANAPGAALNGKRVRVTARVDMRCVDLAKGRDRLRAENPGKYISISHTGGNAICNVVDTPLLIDATIQAAEAHQ